ncbi:L-lactate permease [Leucobacter sp. GX24907]
MLSLIAAIPVVVVLGALVLGQSSIRAAILGVAAVAVLIPLYFPVAPGELLGMAGIWTPVVLEVLLIIAGGVAFAEVGKHSGSQRAVSDWLRGALGTGVAPVLAIVHGVTPLAESLTGFGIGTVLAIPLLVALGLSGRRAAGVGLLGLCAVPWGSMGPGTLIAAELSDVGFDELGVLTAVMNLPVLLGVGIAAVVLTAPRGERMRGLLGAGASGAVLWGAVLATNMLVGTAPAGAVGGLLTLLGHLLVARMRGRRAPHLAPLRRHLTGYAVLLLGVVVAATVVRMLGVQETGLRYVASPALWLLIATAVAALIAGGAPVEAFRSAWGIWLGSAPATGLFIVLGACMAVSGMSATLAAGVAGIGEPYLALLPFVAGIGGFLTGSTSGANAMLAAPQAEAALALGASLPLAMAVHNVAAAATMMASPARVELAVRLAGEPKRATRRTVQRDIALTDIAILIVLAATYALIATR